MLSNVIVPKIYVVDKNRNIHIESKYAYMYFQRSLSRIEIISDKNNSYISTFLSIDNEV